MNLFRGGHIVDMIARGTTAASDRRTVPQPGAACYLDANEDGCLKALYVCILQNHVFYCEIKPRTMTGRPLMRLAPKTCAASWHSCRALLLLAWIPLLGAVYNSESDAAVIGCNGPTLEQLIELFFSYRRAPPAVRVHSGRAQGAAADGGGPRGERLPGAPGRDPLETGGHHARAAAGAPQGAAAACGAVEQAG